jgi:hypothetical protein
MQSHSPRIRALLWTLLVVVVLLNAYALYRSFAPDESLALVSTADQIALEAAAGGVPANTLASTTSKKGLGSYIKELLGGKKDNLAPAAPPPAQPEPELEDPITPASEPDEAEEEELLEEDPLADDLPPEEEEEYEDLYEEELTEEYPAEEIPTEDLWQLEEYPAPVIEESIFIEETPAPSVAPATRTVAPRAPVKPAVVTRKLADLYIGDITPRLVRDLDQVVAGQTLGFDIRVDNGGAAEAAAFVTRIRVDASVDGTWEKETSIAPQGILPIGASQRLLSANAIDTVAPGRSVVEICVDSTSAVAESNERNNCRRVEFTATASAPVAPATASTNPVKGLFNFLSQFVD